MQYVAIYAKVLKGYTFSTLAVVVDIFYTLLCTSEPGKKNLRVESFTQNVFLRAQGGNDVVDTLCRETEQSF